MVIARSKREEEEQQTVGSLRRIRLTCHLGVISLVPATRKAQKVGLVCVFVYWEEDTVLNRMNPRPS